MFDWFPWLAGGSTLALLALAILAPSVLQVAASWLSAAAPLIQGLTEAVVYCVKILWSGVEDILDNWKTIATVIVLALIAVWYFTPAPTPCPVCPEGVKCTAKKSVSNAPRSKAPAPDAWTSLQRSLGF
jgi:p-aminobenzoyl-glutamate transporter AbgT